jgi:hypothetical protein
MTDVIVHERGIFFAQAVELISDVFEFVIRQVVEIDKRCAGAFNAAQEFVELQVEQFGTTILCVLNQKNHQKGDNRGPRVDHELPRVGKAKDRAGDYPHEDDARRHNKSPMRSNRRRRPLGASAEIFPRTFLVGVRSVGGVSAKWVAELSLRIFAPGIGPPSVGS